MISAEEQGFIRLATCLVKLQVADCRVELLVLDNGRLRIAQISKDLVVEEEASLINTLFSLALAAHAQHRFESFQFIIKEIRNRRIIYIELNIV